MKRVLVLLLLLNAVAFALYHFQLIPPLQTKIVQQPLFSEGPSLVLLDERELATESAVKEVELVSVPVEKKAEPEQCIVIDHLVEENSSEIFQLLDQLDVEYSKESRVFEALVNHWVYVPAQATLSDARAMHDKIRKMGVKDVYVIEAGRNKNIVSLGLYSDYAAAESRVKWFASKGIEVKLAPRNKRIPGYYVVIGPVGDEEAESLAKKLPQQNSDFIFQKKLCNEL